MAGIEVKYFSPHSPFLLLGRDKQVLLNPRTRDRVQIKPFGCFSKAIWSYAIKESSYERGGFDLLDTNGDIKKVCRGPMGPCIPLTYPYLLVSGNSLQVWDLVEDTVIRRKLDSTQSVKYQTGDENEGFIFISSTVGVDVWKEKDLLRGREKALIIRECSQIITLQGRRFGLPYYDKKNVFGTLPTTFSFCTLYEGLEKGKLEYKEEFKVDFDEEYKKAYYPDQIELCTLPVWCGNNRLAVVWNNGFVVLTVWDLSESKFLFRQTRDISLPVTYLPRRNSLLLQKWNGKIILVDTETGKSTEEDEPFLEIPDPKEVKVAEQLKELLTTLLSLLPKVLVQEAWNFF